jgi:hypothetical protein
MKPINGGDCCVRVASGHPATTLPRRVTNFRRFIRPIVGAEEMPEDYQFRRGGVTKAGNGRVRRILVEAAWSYRYPPRVGRQKQPKVAAAPRRVREIAWKAQTRLCRRFRSLERKGKLWTVVAMAVARELSAFIWANNREVMGTRQA